MNIKNYFIALIYCYLRHPGPKRMPNTEVLTQRTWDATYTRFRVREACLTT